MAALLLLAVLHGGIAAPSAAAPYAAPPTDAGLAHHGHDSMTDADSGGSPAGDSGMDCCDQSPCDCGCTATPATVLNLATAARDWQRAGAIRAPDAAGFRPATTGAPFRPPA
ncbi:MAG TPA: hypothetical protein VIK49_08815 [Steroidobacteraceae bacterium]